MSFNFFPIWSLRSNLSVYSLITCLRKSFRPNTNYEQNTWLVVQTYFINDNIEIIQKYFFEISS